MSEIEARKKAAERGWLGEPQPARERQLGIIARKAYRYFHPEKPVLESTFRTVLRRLCRMEAEISCVICDFGSPVQPRYAGSG
jgi:hypothetical protein